MTTVARRVRATPVRTATDSWALIRDLIAAGDPPMTTVLDRVGDVAAMLIAEEHTSTQPMRLTGCGPQVRIYTLHGNNAVDGGQTNEQPLQITPSDGWELALPASGVDFDVASASVADSDHVTVYDPEASHAEQPDTNSTPPDARIRVDLAALGD